MDELARLKRRYEREKQARLEAENILEHKSRELFDRNEELRKLSENLELQVEQRTRDLEVARDEALHAAKAKSQFMANMSHEIRTPLNGVIGMLHMLSDGSMEDGQRDLLNTAIRSGQMLLEIVNDILDFSKIDAGQMDLYAEAIDLRVLFADTLAPMRHAARERNLVLNSSFPDDFPLLIEADGLRLRQIINNLLSNALKFTSQGQVRADVILLGDHYEIMISDSGIGMSEEQVERIFSAFGQADGSITRQFGGTGLGLTITQSFIHMMGGTIEVKSVPGEGATFIVKLPLKETEAPEDHTPEQALADDVAFKEARVLLVEDNEVNQVVALHLLSRANIEVDVCNNGEEALTQVQLRPYGVVLMDVQMPVMDGLEATRQIRSFGYDCEKIPIVAMTAHATEEHRKESFDAGMNEHITKPIEPRTLYRVLSRYLKVADPDDVHQIHSDSSETEACSEQSLPTELPGLQIAEGLGRLAGNEKLYLRLITTFYNDQKSLLDRVMDNLKANDWEAMRIALHSAKGSAANISAVAFSEAAAQYEQALKDGQRDDFEGLQENLARQWQILESSVLGLISQYVLERPESGQLDDGQALSLLREIHQWLHQDVSRVDELMEKISSRGYSGKYKDTVSRLNEQLEIFDMGAAEQTLSSLLAEVNE